MGEVAQVVPAVEALATLTKGRRFRLVGDSKLVSYPNLAAMVNARVSFTARRRSPMSAPVYWRPATSTQLSPSTTSPSAMATRQPMSEGATG